MARIPVLTTLPGLNGYFKHYIPIHEAYYYQD